MASQRIVEKSDFVDISHCRMDFPMLATDMHGRPLAFLDSAASAQKPRVVIDVMDEIYAHSYANIHRGLYEISQNLTVRYEGVRTKVAKFIGAESEKTIVFTRNATEAINLVAQSWGRTYLQAGDAVLLTEMEHHANIVPWQLLRDQIGIEIKIIPVDSRGMLDLEAIEPLLTDNVKLLSLVQVSNALGTINPVDDIIAMVKHLRPYITVLVDGSQAVVHSAVDVQALKADFYVFTGHKLYGPTGIGVLYGRQDILAGMPPYQGGGDMIERVSFEKTTFKDAPFRFEAGTPPIVQAIGLGEAVDYIRDIGLDAIAAHESELLKYMIERLRDIPGLKILGDPAERAALVSFTMDCAHPSDIGMVLDQMGVAVRAGHHCCMPLMQRFGLDATVRASLGLYSNREDIDRLMAGLHKVRELFG